MATGDIYRTSVEYVVSGQQNVNVYHMKQTRIDTGDAADAAESMSMLFRTLYGNVVSTSSRAGGFNTKCVKVSRIFSDSGEFFNSYVGSPGVVLTLPPANAIVMRLKTGKADRTRRGRVFIGGICSDRTQDGVLNSSGGVLYAAFAAALQTNFCGNAPVSGFQLGVFSRKRYSLISVPGDDPFEPVIQVQSTNIVATMRSRKVGVGG